MNADATVARTELEQVCARSDLELAQECYAADFVDHVNALDSLELLRQLGLVRTLLAAPRLLRAMRA